MATKKCKVCEHEKDVSHFYKAETSIDKLGPYCRECHVKKCQLRRENKRLKDPMLLWAKDTLSTTKARAKRKGREHSITLDWLLANANTKCPLLGIPITYGAQKHDDHVASLDRKDSNGGYTPENCAVISTRANRIKNDSTIPELELLLSNLRNYR